MGGQTGLNLANTLHRQGFWDEQGVEVVGVDIDAIQITEDRQQFRDLMERIGIDQARSRVAKSSVTSRASGPGFFIKAPQMDRLFVSIRVLKIPRAKVTKIFDSFTIFKLISIPAFFLI